MPSEPRGGHIVVLVLALGAAPAHASGDYHRNLIPGARAASFAGAFTAIADDPGAAYYNPAGLADLHHDTFSLSTSVYAARGVKVSGGQRKNGAVSDTNDVDLFVAPVASGLVKSLNGPESSLPMAWGLFVDQLDVDPLDRVVLLDRSRLGGVDASQFAGLRQENAATTLFGLGAGLRLSPRWTLGASLLLDYHTLEARDTLELAVEPDGGQPLFTSSLTRVNAQSLGAAARVGALFDATERLRLGLCVQSPSLDVWGGGEVQTERATFGGAVGPGGTLEAGGGDNLTAREHLPFEVTAGAAYTVPNRWRIAADLTFDAPVGEYAWLEGPSLGTSLQTEKAAVVDGALGGEYFVADGVALRGGVFTQRSNVVLYDPTQVDATDPGNRYGAVLGAGIATGRVALDLGVIGQWAQGRTVTADAAGPVESNRAEWRLTIFMGASYFFDDTKQNGEK